MPELMTFDDSAGTTTDLVPRALHTPSPPSPVTPSSGISSAIAKFRPTPKEVISGIAPHVFDERRKRRKRSHSPRPSSHYQNKGAGGKTSSPLRVSAVIAWDNESSVIYIEQPDHHHTDLLELDHVSHVSHVSCLPQEHTPIQETNPVIEISGKIDKRRPRGFRIRVESIRMLKTIAVKLRPAPRTSSN